MGHCSDKEPVLAHDSVPFGSPVPAAPWEGVLVTQEVTPQVRGGDELIVSPGLLAVTCNQAKPGPLVTVISHLTQRSHLDPSH